MNITELQKLWKRTSDAAALEPYQSFAEELVRSWNQVDPEVIEALRRYHPELRNLSESEVRDKKFELADAQLVIAQSQRFETWQHLREFAEARGDPNSAISQFESAVSVVVAGYVTILDQLLAQNPKLARARSAREHGATLLHYTSANGVEDYRQKTPKNIVEIARVLIRAGAEVDADLAYGTSPRLQMRYPGRAGSTTLGLAATSIHPARAGVQIALMKTLLDSGANVNGIRDGWNFVNGCLANGRPEAAHFLAERGSRLDLEGAAGIGRLDLVRSFFDEDGGLRHGATRAQMESGFMWACEFGHPDVIEFLLDVKPVDGQALDIGVKVNGMTGLHWAMVGGHLDTIKLLLHRNAPLEAENDYGGTALGCAIWAVANSDIVYRWPDVETDWLSVVEMLIDAGAKVYESDSDFPTGNGPVDELLRRNGMKP